MMSAYSGPFWTSTPKNRDGICEVGVVSHRLSQAWNIVSKRNVQSMPYYSAAKLNLDIFQNLILQGLLQGLNSVNMLCNLHCAASGVCDISNV